MSFLNTSMFSNKIVFFFDVQLTRALTDFKGLIMFIGYMQMSIIANIKNKFLKGLK